MEVLYNFLSWLVKLFSTVSEKSSSNPDIVLGQESCAELIEPARGISGILGRFDVMIHYNHRHFPQAPDDNRRARHRADDTIRVFEGAVFHRACMRKIQAKAG